MSRLPLSFNLTLLGLRKKFSLPTGRILLFPSELRKQRSRPPSMPDFDLLFDSIFILLNGADLPDLMAVDFYFSV